MLLHLIPQNRSHLGSADWDRHSHCRARWLADCWETGSHQPECIGQSVRGDLQPHQAQNTAALSLHRMRFLKDNPAELRGPRADRAALAVGRQTHRFALKQRKLECPCALTVVVAESCSSNFKSVSAEIETGTAKGV